MTKIVDDYSATQKCTDCLRTIQEVRVLYTAPNRDLVCTECYAVRTGEAPKTLRELNEEAGRRHRAKRKAQKRGR